MATGSWQRSTDPVDARPLDSKLASRLEKALQVLDDRDERFARNRAEERAALLAKNWSAMSSRVESTLRAIGRALHESHQVSLDMGIDGVSEDTTPWVIEIRQTFPRLEFKMDIRGEVHAITDGRRLGDSDMGDIDYDWLEKMVVTWLVYHAEAHGARQDD